MHVGVSERGMWERCRTKWDYGSFNRQSLGKVMPPVALSLGHMVHEAFRMWQENTEHKLKDFFLIASKDEIERMVSSYTAKVGVRPSQQEMAPIAEAVQLGLAMMENYQTYYGSPLPQGFTLVQPEQQVSIPIPGSEYDHCHSDYVDWAELANGNNNAGTEQLAIHHKYDHPTLTYEEIVSTANTRHSHLHYLDGRMDAIVRDASGLLYIIDHKTYSQRPRLSTLRFNDQFLSYTWMLSKLDIGDVAGIAYDGLWKRAFPPKGKTMADLFTRILLPRTPFELQRFERDLALEVMDMANDPAIYPTRRWQGCWDCIFDPLCQSDLLGEDSDYIRETMYVKHDSDHSPIMETEEEE